MTSSPPPEIAAGGDTDIATFADEPEVVATELIAEEADVPVLVVVIVPVTLVEAEVAEDAPAVIPAAAAMPTAPTSDIFDPFQSSHWF